MWCFDEVVVVFGCVENKGVGDDDFDDVKESWFVSFGFLVDCDLFFRGEELLEFFFFISEDINMLVIWDRFFFYNFKNLVLKWYWMLYIDYD